MKKDSKKEEMTVKTEIKRFNKDGENNEGEEFNPPKNEKEDNTFPSPFSDKEEKKDLSMDGKKGSDAKDTTGKHSKSAPQSALTKNIGAKIQNTVQNIKKKTKNFIAKKQQQKAAKHTPFTPTSKWDEFVYEHIKAPFKRFLGLVEKELRVLLRDKAAMMITYLIPLIVIFMLTVGANQQLISNDNAASSRNQLERASKLEVPRLGIIDLDDSEGFPNRDLSAELVAMFQDEADKGNCILVKSDNQTELEIMLGKGQLNAFIVIPPLFEFNLSIHLPVIITFILDSIDVVGLQGAQALVDAVVQEFREVNGFTGVFNVQKHDVNLPEKAQVFFAATPFMIPLLIFGIGCLTSTQAIVSDIPKDRMVLTPTNKREMMAAKVTANQIIMLGLSLIILFASMAVGLQIRSSWWNYFAILFLMSLNSVMIGVAISAVSKTPLSAFQYFIFIFIFQTVVLLFVEDPRILMWMPIHNFYLLTLNNVLRGQSFWSTRQEFINVFIETVIVYFGAYLFFKHQKTML